ISFGRFGGSAPSTTLYQRRLKGTMPGPQSDRRKFPAPSSPPGELKAPSEEARVFALFQIFVWSYATTELCLFSVGFLDSILVRRNYVYTN
ncbi:MAG: hypothetical protein V4736_03430, partial [Bdellovibrionota bacterium]